MNKLQSIVKMFCIAFLSILLNDCATLKIGAIKDEEQQLATAGFIIRLADTPEKLAQIKSFKQQELISNSKDNKIYYLYADAAICQCIYEGDEQAYQKYLELQREKQIQNIIFNTLDSIQGIQESVQDVQTRLNPK